MTTYVLAGGCFWCFDAVYRRIRGVTEVVSGYTGGHTTNPTYYEVAGGDTGHAESVKVTFDESIVASEVILDLFFLLHDPTTLNRQGADIGPEYRSALFYQNNEQKSEFESALERAKKHWDDPIVTSIEQLDTFYPAETYHQDFYANNQSNGYCKVVIDPKIVKARSAFKDYFMETSL